MINIDLSRIKKEYLLLTCIFLIGVIAFFSYKNIFSPLLSKIKNVSTQIEQKRINIQKASISPEALKKLEGEIEKVKAQIDYYQQKLTVQADVPQILKELNQIVERLNIKIVSINPLERKETLLPTAKQFLLQTPIRIKLNCGYHQLGIFINQIENSPRFMRITELQINSGSKNIWVHQVELVITSYSLVSKQDL